MNTPQDKPITPVNGNAKTVAELAFEKNAKSFLEDLGALIQRYQVVPVAIMEQSPYGIVPKIIYMDKASYDKQFNAAMKQAGLSVEEKK